MSGRLGRLLVVVTGVVWTALHCTDCTIPVC